MADLKPDLKVVPGGEVKVTEQKPEEEHKPAEEKGEHPQFQKRIDQLIRRTDEMQTKFTQEKQLWEQAREKDQEAFNTLSTNYQELTEVLDGVEDKVSASEAPNYDEDPKAYMDWQNSRTVDKIAKMVKSISPASPPATATSTTSTPAGGNSQQPLPPEKVAQEAAMAALCGDYYEVVKETNEDINRDPALKNALWESPNPFKAAYDYGLRKRKLAAEIRQGNLDQSYVEGGTAPVQDANKLTQAEKNFIAKQQAIGVNINEEKYLARKLKIAKRRGQ